MVELDEKQFEELFYKYFDRVYAGLLAKNCSPDVARELTQITFVKIWEYRSSFSFSVPAEAQIFKKSRQIFIDWLRKEAHQRKLMEEMHQVSQNLHPAPLELTDTLQKAVSQLPEKQMQVFRMAYIEGFSRKEIAGRLGIAMKTVDRHIYKALKQLRKTLAFLTIMAIISSGP